MTYFGSQPRVYETVGAHKFFKCLIMCISVTMPLTLVIANEDVKEKLSLLSITRHHNGTLVQFEPPNDLPVWLLLMWTMEPELLPLSLLNRYLKIQSKAPGREYSRC